MGENCPECKSSVQTVDATAIGTRLPQEVVSYLRQNPEVEYVMMIFGDMTLGVRQALDAAGMSSIKIVSQSGSERNLEAVEEGAEAVNIPEAQELEGWMMSDAMARALNEEELEPEDIYQVVPKNYVTKENVAEVPRPYEGVENFPEQFEELWKVAR